VRRPELLEDLSRVDAHGLAVALRAAAASASTTPPAAMAVATSSTAMEDELERTLAPLPHDSGWPSSPPRLEGEKAQLVAAGRSPEPAAADSSCSTVASSATIFCEQVANPSPSRHRSSVPSASSSEMPTAPSQRSSGPWPGSFYYGAGDSTPSTAKQQPRKLVAADTSVGGGGEARLTAAALEEKVPLDDDARNECDSPSSCSTRREGASTSPWTEARFLTHPSTADGEAPARWPDSAPERLFYSGQGSGEVVGLPGQRWRVSMPAPSPSRSVAPCTSPVTYPLAAPDVFRQSSGSLHRRNSAPIGCLQRAESKVSNAEVVRNRSPSPQLRQPSREPHAARLAGPRASLSPRCSAGLPPPCPCGGGSLRRMSSAELGSTRQLIGPRCQGDVLDASARTRTPSPHTHVASPCCATIGVPVPEFRTSTPNRTALGVRVLAPAPTLSFDARDRGSVTPFCPPVSVRILAPAATPPAPTPAEQREAQGKATPGPMVMSAPSMRVLAPAVTPPLPPPAEPPQQEPVVALTPGTGRTAAMVAAPGTSSTTVSRGPHGFSTPVPAAAGSLGVQSPISVGDVLSVGGSAPGGGNSLACFSAGQFCFQGNAAIPMTTAYGGSRLGALTPRAGLGSAIIPVAATTAATLAAPGGATRAATPRRAAPSGPVAVAVMSGSAVGAQCRPAGTPSRHATPLLRIAATPPPPHVMTVTPAPFHPAAMAATTMTLTPRATASYSVPLRESNRPAAHTPRLMGACPVAGSQSHWAAAAAGGR